MSNRKIWDYWSKRYEKLWVQKYSLAPTRRAVLNLIAQNGGLEKKAILDMGCGTGQLIVQMCQHCPGESGKIIGVDYSEGMLQIARERAPAAQFLLRDISQISSLKQRFDIITCTHSLPYYPDQGKAISDLGALLTPNGLLMIACASENTFYDKIALGAVKLTTGSAKYPSILEMKSMAAGMLKPVQVVLIKERWFMPTIVVIVFQKKEMM